VLFRDSAAFRAVLWARLKLGRDRLLELHSFDRAVADDVIRRIRAAEADSFLRGFLLELVDHFGVRTKEHEEGDVFLDPSHAYIESFPSIPADGRLATFDRRRAIAREDIRFLSADHSLVQDAIDLLVDSPAGTTAFVTIEADEPNLLLEAVFVLEAVAESRWHIDQFLAPTPVRVVVDVRGNDLTTERDPVALARFYEDGDIHRFLEQPGFNGAVLKEMLENATDRANEQAAAVKRAAEQKAVTALSSELQRLLDLQKVNPNVRAEEVALAREQIDRTRAAVTQARLRLDSLRVILEGAE
jgi:ATP-dependent helicase HepA